MEEEAEEIATEAIVFLGPVCGHSGKRTQWEGHNWKPGPLWVTQSGSSNLAKSDVPYCEMLLLPQEED